MKEEEKTREQLIAELAEVRRCLEELAASEAERKRLQEETSLLEKIAIAVYESEDINAAFFAVLKNICDVTAWVYGEVWVPRLDGKLLERSPAWYGKGGGFGEFTGLSEDFTFPPGKGLPGRVWASKEPLWDSDVTEDRNFLRTQIARDVGLKAALAIPILAKGEVVAVMVFFMREERKENGKAEKLISAVAAQLGMVIRRKRAEDALIQSEEHFRSMIENSSDLISIVDKDGTVRYVSPSHEKILGYKPEDLAGTNAFAYVHPDDLPKVSDAFNLAVKNPFASQPVEFRFRHKNGSYRFLGSVGKSLLDGSMKGVVVNSRDTTERKEMEEAVMRSEAHYRSIFESSRDCICHISLDGKYLDMNEAGLALYEFDNLEEVLGKSSTASVTENRGAVEEANTRAAGGETVSFQYKSMGKKGKEIWWDSKVVPVRGADGTITSILRISRDITERKRMEDELIKAQRLESIGTLAAGIAHDFNNILAIIMTNISLARMRVNPEDETFLALERADGACKRAGDIVKHLLIFAKGEAPVRKTVDISELIKDSTGLALSGSNCKTEYSLQEDLRPVEADEGQVSQVFHNLIINAAQAMPEGGPIEVHAKNVVLNKRDGLPLEEGRYVKITVKDYGMGIPAEHLQKIFDPYFTTKQRGSGLGLAASYSIIKRHDGHIVAESKMGVGTTFHVYLPASEGEVIKRKEVKKTSPPTTGNILIMEDEEDLRKATGDLLKRMGYEVETAKDGAEAIEIYKKAKKSGKPFDIVVLDLTVPGGMGGKETIKRLKKLDPDVKAIVSSGYSYDPICAEFENYGLKGVIVKPYNMEELREMLNKVLGKK